MFRLIFLAILVYAGFCVYRMITKRSKKPDGCPGQCVGCSKINQCLSKEKPELRNGRDANFNNQDDDNNRPSRF